MGYKIGTTSGNMVTLASLGVVDPRGIYQSYSKAIEVPSGYIRGHGLPKAIWHWDYCHYNWRNTLRTYCTGASVLVYIETITTEKVSNVVDAYKQFSAIMRWPEIEEIDMHYRMDFEIEFINLVAVV